ncbi:Uncharacterized protein Fot_41970 [Forsythia ovata]|uniref:Uncharacterized protein n=1 Tax=Forsythia ovata TaxID=205694 RepID=A0ABD1RLN0_9LAMI
MAQPPFFSLSGCCNTTLLARMAQKLCQSYQAPLTCPTPTLNPPDEALALAFTIMVQELYRVKPGYTTDLLRGHGVENIDFSLKRQRKLISVTFPASWRNSKSHN